MSHTSAGYSIIIRLRYPDAPKFLGMITSVIGTEGGSIGAVDVVSSRQGLITRDFTVNASNVEHGERIAQTLKSLEDVTVVNISDRVFLMHLGGKLEIHPRVPIKTRDDLSMAYTPGVARVCTAIANEPDDSFRLTIRRNTIAVVSDGSAVLGLGNIGPRAAMPVMEGKAILFKEFANVDAFPICLQTQDVEEIIQIVKALEPTFGGINLEDISAPRCVEIEERLSKEMEIPVFHDDQHGTAIVVYAALFNALKLIGKSPNAIRVVVNGAGAAGAAVTRLLMEMGIQHIIVCDRQGAISTKREELNVLKKWLAEHTNQQAVEGDLKSVLVGADVFIGVSSPNLLQRENIKTMAKDPIIFALANPDPEITPAEAAPHVKVMATGRSDYPNQINNVLCFPGLFRGLLDVRAREINLPMKIAAAQAIAEIIPSDELHADYIIPSVFDPRCADAVALAVSQVAIETGAARKGHAAI